MNYISRENLIRSILNEDMYYDDESDTVYATAKPHDEKIGGPWYKHMPKAEMKGKNKDFVFPSLAQSEAAAPSAGDPQTAQIVIMSELLVEFGILSKAITTKKLAYEDSNEAEISSLIKDTEELFGSENNTKPMFPAGTPVEMIPHMMNNSTSELEKIYKVRFDVLLGRETFRNRPGKGRNISMDTISKVEQARKNDPAAAKKFWSEYYDDKNAEEEQLTWEKLLKIDPATKADPKLSKIFPKGIAPLLMSAIDEYIEKYNKSADLYSTYKLIFDYLVDIVKEGKYKTPAAFAKRVELNDLLQHRLTYGKLGKYFNKAMSSGSVSTTDELGEAMIGLMSKDISGERVDGDKMKVIHYKLSRIIREYAPRLRKFSSFVEHLEKNNRFRYNELLNNFNMTDEELKSFDTFRSFCEHIFADPELTAGLYQRANVQERARRKGDIRQATDLAVNARALNKQIARGGTGKRGRKAMTASDYEAKIEALKKQIEETEFPDEKEALEFKLKNLIKARDKKLSVSAVDAHEAEADAVEQNMSKLKTKLFAILQKRMDEIDDENAREDFLNRNDRAGHYRKHLTKGDDEGSDLLLTKFTYFFPAATWKAAGEQISKYFDKMADKLEKKFNKAEVAEGKEALVSVYVSQEPSRGKDTIIAFEFEYDEKCVARKTMRRDAKEIMYDIIKPFPREATGVKIAEDPIINQVVEY